MSEGTTVTKMIPIIVITWVLSLVTTLAIVYVAPSIFPVTVSTENLADSAVITTKLADGTVNSAKIVDGTLTALDIADGSITTIKVDDGAVTVDKIADGSVTTQKIADDAVSTDKIEDQAVKTSDIADSAIVTLKLADNSVTSAKILDGTVTAIDLATNAVTAIKIEDGAVTTSKIADEAVTDVKLAAQAIPFASAWKSVGASTAETVGWVDMDGMYVNLTLNRQSHLLIMFSATIVPDWDERIRVRAMVGEEFAFPGYVPLTPEIVSSDASSYYPSFGAYTFNFYEPSVVAGTYSIKIVWQVSGGTGWVYYRMLTVIALPA